MKYEYGLNIKVSDIFNSIGQATSKREEISQELAKQGLICHSGSICDGLCLSFDCDSDPYYKVKAVLNKFNVTSFSMDHFEIDDCE